ncbi:MAG: DUF1788 domain-containing protein [Sulfurospirillum sp.]
MSKIIDDFEQIFTQVTTEKFLSMQALGGEEPFFIYSFDPIMQDLVSSETKRLQKRVEQAGHLVLVINLYQLTIKMLNERNMLTKILDKEPSLPKSKLLQTLQNMLDVETKIMSEIQKLVDEKQTSMVFIEGIGEVYPYIRSHTIINNLQKVIVDRPTLMFFPGRFDGHKLVLFNRVHDDNHYRAFNIINYSF